MEDEKIDQHENEEIEEFEDVPEGLENLKDELDEEHQDLDSDDGGEVTTNLAGDRTKVMQNMLN